MNQMTSASPTRSATSKKQAASVEFRNVTKRYGAVTVIFARFVNVLRQLNGVVAGTLGMHWLKFLAYNAIGAALWVSFSG